MESKIKNKKKSARLYHACLRHDMRGSLLPLFSSSLSHSPFCSTATHVLFRAWLTFITIHRAEHPFFFSYSCCKSSVSQSLCSDSTPLLAADSLTFIALSARTNSKSCQVFENTEYIYSVSEEGGWKVMRFIAVLICRDPKKPYRNTKHSPICSPLLVKQVIASNNLYNSKW